MPLMDQTGPGRAGLFVHWARPGRADICNHLNGPDRAGPTFCRAGPGRAGHFRPVQSTNTLYILIERRINATKRISIGIRRW